MKNYYIYNSKNREQYFYNGNMVLNKLHAKCAECFKAIHDSTSVNEIMASEIQFINDTQIHTAIISLLVVDEIKWNGDNVETFKTKEVIQRITINLATKKITGLGFLEAYIDNNPYIEDNELLGILNFLISYIRLSNPYLYAEIEEKNLYNGGCKAYLKTVVKNTFKICRNLNGAEGLFKITKANAARKMLRDDNFELKEAKKLSKVIELPVFALEFMSSSNMPNLLSSFKRIEQIDGNTLKMFVDYLTNIKRFGPKTQKEQHYINFCENIADLLERGYSFMPLLKYISRQQLYTKRCLGLPEEIVQLLKDYYDMASNMGINFDKYPQNIEKSHYVISNNYALSISPDLRDKFKQLAVDNTHLGVKGSQYSLVVPMTVDDMINEGNVLHHCVATYCKKVIMKETNVLFFRDNSKLDEPLITIELTNDFRLAQAKGSWNQDASAEQLKEINELISKIKA